MSGLDREDDDVAHAGLAISPGFTR
jgi:hypothetical protein